jgi:C4-dicarboxylate-specific signal transduction histidine kinase
MFKSIASRFALITVVLMLFVVAEGAVFYGYQRFRDERAVRVRELNEAEQEIAEIAADYRHLRNFEPLIMNNADFAALAAFDTAYARVTHRLEVMGDSAAAKRYGYATVDLAEWLQFYRTTLRSFVRTYVVKRLRENNLQTEFSSLFVSAMGSGDVSFIRSAYALHPSVFFSQSGSGDVFLKRTADYFLDKTLRSSTRGKAENAYARQYRALVTAAIHFRDRYAEARGAFEIVSAELTASFEALSVKIQAIAKREYQQDEIDRRVFFARMVWMLAVFTLVMAGWILVLVRGTVRPISGLSRVAESVRHGDLTARFSMRAFREMEELGASFNGMLDTIHEKNGELHSMQGALEDRVMDLRRSEESLKTALRTLRETQEQLVSSEKMAALGRLSAGIAHELKNPLAVVMNAHFVIDVYAKYIGEIMKAADEVLIAHRAGTSVDFSRLAAAAETAKDKAKRTLLELTQDLKKNNDLVLKESERMRAIIKSLNMFSHPSDEDFEHVAMNEVIESALAISAHEISGHCVVVKECEDGLLVKGSPNRLTQVFINLFVNAAQAVLPPQGLLRIQAYRDGKQVVIIVSDNGSGIAAEHKDHIFDPFFTTKERGKGSGLGLSIVYSIVTSHKGAIAVDSEVGKGTTFTVTFPSA